MSSASRLLYQPCFLPPFQSFLNFCYCHVPGNNKNSKKDFPLRQGYIFVVHTCMIVVIDVAEKNIMSDRTQSNCNKMFAGICLKTQYKINYTKHSKTKFDIKQSCINFKKNAANTPEVVAELRI